MTAKFSKKEWISKFINKHGTRYSYENFETPEPNQKATFTCAEHGDFMLIPAKHAYGKGCPECGKAVAIASAATQSKKRKQNAADNFVSKSRIMHGDKYDYSLAQYDGWDSKVSIVCPVHGIFIQSPSSHLKGHGCSICSRQTLVESFKNAGSSSFENKANKVHNNTYDYSKTRYINSKTPTTIVCNRHGEFMQTPAVHLKGSGCPACGDVSASVKNSLTTEEFIEKARIVHGDKYSYEKTEYINVLSDISINCKMHGEFMQNAGRHMRGSGCPSCTIYGFKTNETACLYILDVVGTAKDFTGYGITGDIKTRYDCHERNLKKFGFHIENKLIVNLVGIEARNLEKELSKNFIKSSQQVEGFKREATSASFIEVCRFVEEYLRSK